MKYKNFFTFILLTGLCFLFPLFIKNTDPKKNLKGFNLQLLRGPVWPWKRNKRQI